MLPEERKQMISDMLQSLPFLGKHTLTVEIVRERPVILIEKMPRRDLRKLKKELKFRNLDHIKVLVREITK